jgi:hypothetical protein
MVEIRNKDDFERFFTNKPAQLAAQIVSRRAMRFLPVLGLIVGQKLALSAPFEWGVLTYIRSTMFFSLVGKGRAGSGNLHSGDKWIFRLNAGHNGREQERL